MKEKLEKEKLQKITLDVSSVIWLKKGKEILVHGEPFDIKSFTRNEEKIIFTGLYDHQEKKLIKQLEVYYHSKNKSASAFNSMLLLFFTPYYHTNEPIDLNPGFFVHKQKYLQWPGNNTSRIFKDKISPPPRSI